MKRPRFTHPQHFMLIGLLMAFLGISFLLYMGNSLYQTSQRMHNENSSTYAAK